MVILEILGKDTFVIWRYVKVFNVALVVKCVVEVDMMVGPAPVATQHAALTYCVQDTTMC